mgnify:CR=1 FL=1
MIDVAGATSGALDEALDKFAETHPDHAALVKLRYFAGLTADECAAVLGESVLSIRPRFSELLGAGLIRETGQRRRNASGKMADVLVAA